MKKGKWKLLLLSIAGILLSIAGFIYCMLLSYDYATKGALTFFEYTVILLQICGGAVCVGGIILFVTYIYVLFKKERLT